MWWFPDGCFLCGTYIHQWMIKGGTAMTKRKLGLFAIGAELPPGRQGGPRDGNRWAT